MELDKVFLRGRMIDARDTMNDTKIKKDEAPLVPGDWLLIKRSPQGVETEVAKSVLAYDFDREGNIVFTNGRATFRCSSGKSPEVIFKNKLTETIICLDLGFCQLRWSAWAHDKSVWGTVTTMSSSFVRR